ncbi:MAG: hypothetical protein IKV57_04435 [Clostridia bacterium]|nr:hypothetical protein [Clostridia bacterium]
MTETTIAGGILLRVDRAPLPDTLADPIRERWQTDEEDDTVDRLLAHAAAITDAGAFLRPAKIGAPDGDTITLDGFPIRSTLAVEKLSAAGETAVGYVMTCGRALYDEAANFKDDFFAAAIWDEIMIAWLRVAGDMTQKYVAARFFPAEDGKKHFSALNPGSLESWDIYGQKELFALLGDGAAAAGVELTPSMLMLPTKTGSGVFFHTDKPYENCMHCPRIDCPNRRAPYHGDSES